MTTEYSRMIYRSGSHKVITENKNWFWIGNSCFFRVLWWEIAWGIIRALSTKNPGSNVGLYLNFKQLPASQRYCTTPKNRIIFYGTNESNSPQHDAENRKGFFEDQSKGRARICSSFNQAESQSWKLASLSSCTDEASNTWLLPKLISSILILH